MKYKFPFLLLFMLLFLAACSLPGTSGSSTVSDAEGTTEASSAESTSRFPENPNKDLDFDTDKLEDIWFAGGCFWGVEAYMARVYGVYDVTSGYANVTTENQVKR